LKIWICIGICSRAFHRPSHPIRRRNTH